MNKIALLSLLLVLVACEEAPTEPSPVDVPLALSPGQASPSASTSAAIIVRGEFVFGFTWIDAEAGLRIVVGYDQAALCQGGTPFDVFSFQNVDIEPGRRVNAIDGVVQTAVWGFTEFDCGRFTTEEPLAAGESTVRGQTNDLFGTGGESINSTTLRAIGELARSSDGGPVRLSAFYKILTREGGILSGAPPVESRIHLR